MTDSKNKIRPDNTQKRTSARTFPCYEDQIYIVLVWLEQEDKDESSDIDDVDED